MYTNRGNISLPIAVWLASDDYDLHFNPKIVSVTELLQPLRSIILIRRVSPSRTRILALCIGRPITFTHAPYGYNSLSGTTLNIILSDP